MSSLQLGLIAAGIALVVGVMIYNWLQERRIRRRIDEAFRDTGSPAAQSRPASGRGSGRVEPTLAADHGTSAMPENAARASDDAADDNADAPYEPPIDVVTAVTNDPAAGETVAQPMAMAPTATRPAPVDRSAGAPDPEIECVVMLQPVRPASAGAIASGLHARIGKPLRWFGRRDAGAPWQILESSTAGQFTEIVACLLLADRTGAAGAPLIEAFARLAGSVASSIPAAFVPPDSAREAARAEALDRICADLDVQIGLTVLKAGPATISGTRLRGVAEAAGFRLADGGGFTLAHDETGTLLYVLSNVRSEPFTADTLRTLSTQGAVFLLDVPRVADPARVFDQMKLAAKRMAQTLDATLVDDNRRALDDAALAAIRQQVRATAAALRAVNIEPGSPRALALFGG